MSIDEVIEWFGNLHRACLALEISVQNMSRWKRRGYINYLQQYRIAEITEGGLMPDAVDPRIAYNAKRKAAR